MAEEAAKSDAVVENNKVADDDESRQEQEKLVRDIEALRMKYNLGVNKKPETSKEFKFWKTQPVPKLGKLGVEHYAGTLPDSKGGIVHLS